MSSSCTPHAEAGRLAALQALHVMDSAPEAEFDALVQAASLVCQAPIAMISLVDSSRQWFKASLGMAPLRQTPRAIAFCAHAIQGDTFFEVPDALQDARFSANPMVTDADGIRFYAAAPLRLSNGYVAGTLCVLDRVPRTLNPHQRDILHALSVAAARALEARASEIQRAEQQRNLQDILDGTGAGTWEWDMVSGHIEVNERWAQILGYTRAELHPVSYASWKARVHPEDCAHTEAAERAHSRRSSERYDSEFRMRHKNGSWIGIHSSGQIRSWLPDGTPHRMFGTYVDISERMQMQRQLDRERRHLANIVTGTDAGTWDCNLQDGSYQINSVFAAMLGDGVEEAMQRIGSSILHITHPHDQAMLRQALLTHIRGRTEQYQAEFRVQHRSGHWVWLLARGRVVERDASGRALHLSGIHLDISARRQADALLAEQLQRAEQATLAKGHFIANMSHEIRTPMNAILGMLTLLGKTTLDARQLDYTHKAQVATRSLLGIINDVLDFSKVDAGKMELDLQPFGLNALMQDLAVLLCANIGTKSVQVLYDMDSRLPRHLLGDSLRLMQVLTNLGGNAVKFTQHGQVVLGVRLEHCAGTTARLRFSVQDSGIGIAPEHQQHIFSGFSQAEASTTRNFGGTGLGLAISRRLVALMGGSLHLESQPGLGSTFSFTLDLQLDPAAPALVGPPAAPAGGARRTLIIDGNAVALRLSSRVTRSWGWPTEEAPSAEQALALVAARSQPGCFPFDVIYLDWQLPGMDGWDATKALRAQARLCNGVQPVIVMVTGNTRVHLGQRTPDEQALLQDFLVKPVTPSMLLDAALNGDTAQARLRQVQRSGSSQRRLEGMRLLVVEDNLINQQVAEELLLSEGASVALAANGRLGVSAVASAAAQFDAVLMDIQMPVMDGYEATRAIRLQLGLAQLPIVAMTANALACDRDACLAAGMNDHVGKPFDLTQLVDTLLQVTGRQAWPAAAAAAAPGAALAAPVDSVPLLPGLELAAALSRLGGLQPLYLRSLQDFSQALPALVEQLQAALAQAPARLAPLLHSWKGTAATVGASALAQAVAALEKQVLAQTDAALLGQRIDALQDTVRQCQASLLRAMDWLQVEVEVAAASGTAAPLPAATDRVALRHDLQRLAHTLRAADLHALERLAALRSALGVLPAAEVAALEEAMHRLDFAAAATLCTALADTL